MVADTSLASRSTAGGLRKLVSRERTGAGTFADGPVADKGKSVTNRGRFDGRRAAPGIDRLYRVPDGGHWMSGTGVNSACAEQRPKNHPLRVTGVLVFVQQHHPVPLAQRAADARMIPHQGRRNLHLIGEVDHAAFPLGVGEGLNKGQDPLAILQAFDMVDQPAVQSRFAAAAPAAQCAVW